jgi:hypothetical protein
MKRIFEITIFSVLASMLISWSTVRQTLNLNDSSGKDSLNLKGLIRVDTFMLDIVPPSAGVHFYRNGILFLAREKNEKKMAPNHISFGTPEAYYTTIIDSATGEHKIFSSNISFPFPCDAVTFSHDFQTIYFTMIPAKGRFEKIYAARITSQQSGLAVWDIKKLDFCSDSARYTHPALSNDGNTLVFASDQPGSAGGMDLFISRKKDGKWSVPVNAGKLINTTGNEYSPFLDKDNNLFFSSDKLPGFGGYDIFSCKYNGTGWDKPVNLGDLINSKSDEIAFSVNENGSAAFFTRKKVKNMQLLRVSPALTSPEKNLLAAINGPVPKNTIALPDTIINQKQAIPEPSKVVAEAAAVTKKQAEKNIAPKENTANKATANAVIIKPTLPISDSQKDIVIYRVQILASQKPLKDKEVILNGTHYTLYEFYYLNAYRYSIGEFTTLQPAVNLQKACRQSGFTQAFVAAFKNNTRSVDLKSFR